MKLLSFAVLACLALNSTQTASAQSFIGGDDEESVSTGGAINQYDDKYKGITQQNEQAAANAAAEDSSPTLIDANEQTIKLVRSRDDSEGVVNLQIQFPVSTQGCATTIIPPASLKKSQISMEVQIGALQTNIDTSIRNPQYECAGSGASPTINIPLATKSLHEEGIGEIVVKTPAGTEKFAIASTDTVFTMISKSGKTAPLTHKFYNKNTIILRAPLAANAPELSQKISALGQKYALTPLPELSSKNSFYFSNDQDSLPVEIPTNSSIKLDTIEIDDIFIGANGTYTVAVPVDVFVALPGEQE